MTGRDIFKIWAPYGVKWVDWVRPVPFIGIDSHKEIREFYNFSVPKILYIDKLSLDTAIFIDLSGYASINEGIALAKMGYRPIPIYNGTIEQENSAANVNNGVIVPALVWGALELQKIDIKNETTPVFLLDSNRMHRYRQNASIFDNSWDIYHQDIPSADYFLKNGIDKIIVRGETFNKDLKKIFYKFQKKGITIMFTNGYEEPKKIIVKKPTKKELNEG